MKRIKVPVRQSKKTFLSAKICNLCGCDTVEYQVIDNAPVCFECVPRQEIKTIPNEKSMIQKILDKKA